MQKNMMQVHPQIQQTCRPQGLPLGGPLSNPNRPDQEDQQHLVTSLENRSQLLQSLDVEALEGLKGNHLMKTGFISFEIFEFILIKKCSPDVRDRSISPLGARGRGRGIGALGDCFRTGLRPSKAMLRPGGAPTVHRDTLKTGTANLNM